MLSYNHPDQIFSNSEEFYPVEQEHFYQLDNSHVEPYYTELNAFGSLSSLRESSIFSSSFDQEHEQYSMLDTLPSLPSFLPPIKEINPFEQSFGTFESSPTQSSECDFLASLDLRSSSQDSLPELFNSTKSKRGLNKADRLLKNRVAASKCRQKKREWLKQKEEENRQADFENDMLAQEVSNLKDEIMNIRMVLAAHQNCSITGSE